MHSLFALGLKEADNRRTFGFGFLSPSVYTFMRLVVNVGMNGM